MIHICVLGEPGNEANSNYAILCQNAKSHIDSVHLCITQCTLIFYCYIIQMSCHVNKHETLVTLKIGKHNCSHSSVFYA